MHVSMVHNAPDLLVNEDLAKELGQRDRENLLKNKKLILLVDLDETVVHTTNRRPTYREFTQDIIGYRLENGRYFTKLRPYARRFLERCHAMYEMHVVSYGQRNYARKIADMLDPKKVYFAERILSRDELISSVHKTQNLKHLFPCGDEMVIMIDDRSEVWQNSDAHILVKPYRYFEGVFDINNPMATTPFSLPVQTQKKIEKQPKTQAESNVEINVETDCDEPSTSGKNLTSSNLTEKPEDNTSDKLESDLLDENKEESLITDVKDEEEEDVINDTEMKADFETPEPPKSTDAAEENKISEENAIEREHCFSNLQDSLEKDVKMNTVPEQVQQLTPVDSDVTLKRIEKILCDIHTEFFKGYDEAQNNKTNSLIDVKQIISQIKKNVLCNEYIVLSGVIPLNTDPSQNDLYREAERFGAHVQPQIDNQTTVVVARLPDTEKVKEARRRGLPIVSIDWLRNCIFEWENVSKEEFSLFKNFPKKSNESVLAGKGNDDNREDNTTSVLGNTGLSEIETIDKDSLIKMENEVDEALSGDDEDDVDDEGENNSEKQNASSEDSMDEMAADVEHLLEGVEEAPLPLGKKV